MVTICAWEVGGTDFEQFFKLLLIELATFAPTSGAGLRGENGARRGAPFSMVLEFGAETSWNIYLRDTFYASAVMAVDVLGVCSHLLTVNSHLRYCE